MSDEVNKEEPRLGTVSEASGGTIRTETSDVKTPSEYPLMPLYQSHKIVQALKIDTVVWASTDNYGSRKAILAFELGHSGYPPLEVDEAFVSKHNPQVGNYLVRYSDGYMSVSPEEPFESGYYPLSDIGGIRYCPGLVDFSVALRFAKAGRRIHRAGWNGKGMWVELQRPDAGSKMTLPYLYLNYPVYSETKGVGNPAYPEGSRVPWLASQTDQLAEDWIVE